jgi:hypothetical protein
MWRGGYMSKREPSCMSINLDVKLPKHMALYKLLKESPDTTAGWLLLLEF